MIRFNTRNSIYEVNDSLHLIRRVVGLNPPCSSQPADDEWREYKSIRIRTGEGALVFWADLDDRVTSEAPAIATSVVKSIAEGDLQLEEFIDEKVTA